MKQTLTLFAALVLLAVGATAQKLSYSAVVRNSANELQANKTLTVGVSIANNATGNPAVYSETHSGVQTNQNGLLTLTIGEGTNVSGNLTQVTWPSAYITTTYTIDGSTVTNTVAVNAVPYALYAENSGTSTPVNDGVLTITMPDGTTKTFTANQLGNTNVTIPAAPTVNDGTLTIKQGENTLGTFSANQSGTTNVNIPAAPTVNDGTLTITTSNGTSTFTANQSGTTDVTIPTYTLTAGDLINVINNMTAEEKARMCAALAALGCSGTEPTPPTPTPVCPSVDLEGNTFQLNKGTENYSASFGYNPGSGNPTVTATYSTTSGGAFQCTNCMTVNAIGGVISISIPVDAITLSPAEQLIVTITITSDVCDQVLTLTGTYEETQIPTFECPTFTNDPTALTLTADGAEIMAYTSEYVEENTAVTNYGFRVYTVTDGVETLLFTLDHSNYPNNVYPEIDNDNDKAYIGAFVSMSDLPTITGISLDVLAAVGTLYKVYPFITCTNVTNNGNPVEYTVSGGETPTTDCPTFIIGETELQASDSKYIALISYTGGSGNETVSGKYTVANVETPLALDQTLFINRTNRQVRVEIEQSAVSLTAGDQLFVEITLTDGTCTQSTATGVYTEPAEGDDCPQWGDVTGTSFLVLNNGTVQLKLFGHNFTGVTQEAFEVMLNETTEQTFTMVNGDDGDYEYIILTGNQVMGVDYADATYRITYTPSQNCEQSSGLEVEGSFAICPYFVEATSITAASAYEFVVSTPYAKSGDFIIENGGYKVYTTPNLGTPVATVQMTPATQIVVTADNDELIAIVDLTDLITPEALALLDGQTLYIQPFLMTMECGTVTGEVLQYIVQEPTPTTPVDGQPCPGAEMVTDNDPTPNTYATVQIGNQCWMAENLRSTRYSDGTPIAEGTNASSTTSYRYAPNNNADNVAIYGYLYNWAAVMHGASSSEANPSGVQGICPTGWHVPSDAEWTQLQEYVSNYKENNEFKYRCNDDSTYIAKALASTTGWKTNGATVNSPCEPRYNPATKNNASGFGAMPAGFYRGYYYYFGYDAYFWSSTNLNSGSAWYRDLISGYAYVNRSYDDKSSAYSVRCLKN